MLRVSRNLGIQRERQVRDHLTAQDWVVIHTRPGTNFCDIVALKDGHTPRFVEVKSTAGGPYERFLPARRHELRQIAEWAGAEAFLAWWPPRGELHWFHSSEWPDRVFTCVIDESAGLADAIPP